MVDSIHPIGHEGADTLRAQAVYFQAAQATPPSAKVQQAPLEAAEEAAELRNALTSEVQLSNTLRTLFEKAVSAMGRNDSSEMSHYLIQYFKLLDAAQPGWKISLSQGMGVKRYGATWMLASLKEINDGPHAAQLLLAQSLAQEVKTAEQTQSVPLQTLTLLRQTLQTVENHTTDAIAHPPRPDMITPTLQQSAQQLRQSGQADWSDRLNLYALMQAQLQVLRAQRPFLGRNDYLARTGLPAAYLALPVHPVDHASESLAWQAFSPIERTDRVEPIGKDPNEAEQRRRRRDQVRQADKLLHIDGDEDEDAIGGW